MEALITCLQGGLYTLYDLDKKIAIPSKARGKFRLENESPKVGDYVEYQMMDDNKAYIIDIKPRKNELLRPAISNIDQALILFSVKEPEFNTNLLDRFLAILEFNNLACQIVFTKWDLLKPEEKQEMQKIAAYYEQVGYPHICTSTKTPVKEGLAYVKELITNKISVFAGQSGVGKSSLINELAPGLNLKTNEISFALGRGKHTTRHVELISILDGWVADTPGFGIMNFEGMEEMDLAHSFREFFEFSKECKFNGCQHVNEPGCAIKKRVGKDILESRYENYLSFLGEIKKQRKW